MENFQLWSEGYEMLDMGLEASFTFRTYFVWVKSGE